VFDRWTTEADRAEVFGVVEFVLPVPDGFTRKHGARMIFDRRIPAPAENDGRILRFRFSPRDAKVWSYSISSDFPALDRQQGKFTAVEPSAERTARPSRLHPNWWTDDPDPVAAEGIHSGAKSVNRWRAEFLQDFAARMDRCQSPRA
jgi:hypothetical protein